MKNLKHFNFRDPIFNINVEFIIGDNKKFDNYIKKNYKIDSSVHGNDGHTKLIEESISGRQTIIIWLEYFDIHNPKDFNCLTHECLHATYIALEQRGILINYENQETVAYIIGYLIEKIMEFINEN